MAKFRVATVALAGVLLCGATYLAVRRVLHRENVVREINVTLISPTPSGDGVITVEGSRVIPVRWRVKNVSGRPLEGLTVQVSCKCQVDKPLPHVLFPGETAEFAMNVTSPNAGRATRSLPIYAKDHNTPIDTLLLDLYVAVVPPAWIAPPQAIEFRVISGDKASKEYVWDAVEMSRSPHWFSKVTIDDDFLKVRHQVEEQPWSEDSQVVLRKYRVMFVPNVDDENSRVLRTMLRFHQSVLDESQSFPVTVSIVPATSIVPASVILEADSAPKRILLIRRLSGIGPITTSFSTELIAVEARNDDAVGPLTYYIKPLQKVSQEIETEVRFFAQGIEQSRLSVRLTP